MADQFRDLSPELRTNRAAELQSVFGAGSRAGGFAMTSIARRRSRSPSLTGRCLQAAHAGRNPLLAELLTKCNSFGLEFRRRVLVPKEPFR